MSQYKIGVTEAGDAGIDLSWEDKLDNVDGAILITKQITPEFIDKVITHKDKIIVHSTITGYGHSILEPKVPYPGEEILATKHLVDAGFPKEKIVIRVDPIIPTEKGLFQKALDKVFRPCLVYGFKRYRISIIDMYPSVRKRFLEAGLPLPYENGMFSPSKNQIHNVDLLVAFVNIFSNTNDPIRIESCAEPGLTQTIQCGCVSAYDLALLGLNPSSCDETGFQRKHCLCYSGKKELLQSKHPCLHGCLYCYWR